MKLFSRRVRNAFTDGAIASANDKPERPDAAAVFRCGQG